MLFKEIIHYLKGEKFHNGLQVDIPIENVEIKFRNDYLVKLAINKKILHIGFVDHLPLIDKKIKNNNWLHNKLIKAAKKCIGIDINKEGVKYLQNNYSIPDIYAIDILNDDLPDVITKEQFDYLFLPDVIEHIGNPVLFLEKLKNKFPNVSKFIITTPNAFCYDNFKFALKNKECVNTDHRFWFSAFTISKILIDSGYKLEKIIYVEHSDRFSRKALLKNTLIKKYPLLRDTIIMEAR